MPVNSQKCYWYWDSWKQRFQTDLARIPEQGKIHMSRGFNLTCHILLRLGKIDLVRDLQVPPKRMLQSEVMIAVDKAKDENPEGATVEVA